MCTVLSHSFKITRKLVIEINVPTLYVGICNSILANPTYKVARALYHKVQNL